MTSLTTMNFNDDNNNNNQYTFLEQDALKNIVSRVLISKGANWAYNSVAISRVGEFLAGGKELSRDEKDKYLVDSNPAYEKIVDYKQLERFSYKAFLPFGSNSGLPTSPDFSLDASWIDSDGAYSYTMSMHLNVLTQYNMEYISAKKIQCPPNKNWVVGYIQWNLAAAPEGTYEYNWVGKSAGVELVTGFIQNIDSKGMIVDPKMLQNNNNKIEIISSKFDLIGYACFSPLELLGADFYRFSIKKGGEVRGNTLSLAPAIPWQNPMIGRAYKVPKYCELKIGNTNAALNDLGSAKSVDDLMSSFSNLAVKVEAGKVPTLTVTDVVVAGRQHRLGRFENDWTPDVARAFGDVLISVKRNNDNNNMESNVNPIKRKNDDDNVDNFQPQGGGLVQLKRKKR